MDKDLDMDKNIANIERYKRRRTVAGCHWIDGDPNEVQRITISNVNLELDDETLVKTLLPLFALQENHINEFAEVLNSEIWYQIVGMPSEKTEE